MDHDLVYKEETYRIIGICMEVHNQLGPGSLEIVYKDALEYEFQRQGILYEREKEYIVHYKDIVLKHKFWADFVVMDTIILEAKAISGLVDEFFNRTVNYLKVSDNKLGLIVNFGKDKLEYKRVVY
jgi:GxxExxY protein